MRVSPDERKIRKQLEETRKPLESWDGWSPHEAAGRCLRWLGESEEAAEHFRIAASKRHVLDPPTGFDLVGAATCIGWPENTKRRGPSSVAVATC